MPIRMTSRPQTLTEKILKGSSIVLIFTLLGSPIGYLIRVLYSNSLSIEMFGLFYAALAFFTLLSTYLDLGLGYSTAYFIPKFAKKNDFQSISSIFHYYQIIQLAVTIITSVILILNAKFLATHYFKTIEAIEIIYLFSGYLVINGIFATLNMFFIGLQKEFYYSSMQFLRLFLILSLSGLFFILHLNNIVFYSACWAISNLLIVIIYYFVVNKKYSYIFHHLHWDKTLLTSMISYGVPTLVTASFLIFITSIDSIFLTYFKGVREVGIYSVIFPLATISGLILSPINTMILPLVSHLMEDEGHKVSDLIHSVLKLVPFISLYFGLFVALFPNSIVTAFFGNKWAGLVEAPLVLFSLGYVFAPLSNLLITIISGMGKVKERLKLSIIIVCFSLLVNLIFIPTFGVLGAALANTMVYILSVLLFTWAISKSFKLTYSYSFYLKLIAFSFAVFVCVKFFKLNPNGILQIVLFGIIYTVLFITFGISQKVIDDKMRVSLQSWVTTHIGRLRKKSVIT